MENCQHLATSTNYVQPLLSELCNDSDNMNGVGNEEVKSTDSDSETYDDENRGTRCGIGRCKPKWLQMFAHPKIFVANFAILGVIQGSQFTYLLACLSTLEKRYSYKSKYTGLIMIADELTPILLGALVGYFGGRTHRPRLISAGMMMSALSCFIFALPYFIYGANVNLSVDNLISNRSEKEFCDFKDKSERENCEFSPTVLAISLLFIANFAKGFGILTYYVTGTTYLDDSVKKKNTPIYLGILYTFRLLGPVFGFLLASFFLQFYEDPFHDPGFTPDDPRWIGAWWLGFVCIGIAIFFVSLPIMLFPRRFPGTTTSALKDTKVKSPLKHLRDMQKSFRRVFINPLFIFYILGCVLYVNGMIGYFMMLPKYMERQFRQSASKASLYAGTASMVSMQVGFLTGGIAVQYLKPNPKQLTMFLTVTEAFACVGLFISLFIKCPNIEMPGTIQDERFSLYNPCNADCACSTAVYTPVCGANGTYFSPCFAGCTEYNLINKTETYSNCHCIADNSTFHESSIQDGYCPSDCNMMLPYLIVLCLVKFISATSRVASAIVMLRMVKPEDKNIALGLLESCLSLFGFVPYPLIFGAITDSACLVWEESCGKTGNCWVYHNDNLRYLLHGVPFGLMVLVVFSQLGLWYYSPMLSSLYEEESKEEAAKPMNITAGEITNGDLGEIPNSKSE